MTIPSSLIAAIRAFPDEDGPRESLAFWYEQRGDPRAEFIRAQIALSSLSARYDDLSLDEMGRFDALEETHARLLEEHENSWLDEWGLHRDEVEWTRGIPSSLLLSWHRFAEVVDTALEAPVVHLHIRGEPGEGDESRDIAALLRSAALVGLSGLDFSRSRFHDDQLDALVDGLLECPAIENLLRLNLSGIPLHHGRIKRLVHLEAPRLRELRLASTKIGTTGAAALALAPMFERLDTLDLSGNRLGAVGVRPILRALGSRALRTLHLDDNHMGPEGAREMVLAPPMKGLQTLTLGGNDFGPDGAQALLPNLGGVRVLDLSFNSLGPDGVAAIPTSRKLDALVELDLSYNEVHAEGVRRFLQSPRLPSLRRLDLSQNALSLRSVEYLLRSPLLGRLHALGLAGNHLHDAGMEALARSKQVAELRELDVQDNLITWRGVEALVESTHLPRLWRLLVSESRLEQRAYEMVQARCPYGRRRRLVVDDVGHER